MKQSLLILFCLILTACAGNENPRGNSSNQTANAQPKPAEAVRFSAEKTQIKAGNSGEAVLKLKIQPPFHVNANPPSEDNLIPTTIEFESKNGLTFEKPNYPAGELKKFQFSENPLLIYEGEVEIKLPVKADAKAAKGEQTVNGKLRFQACDEAVCYRPETVDVVLPIEIS
ncbi:MAG TPA: protein-disulfide reductase DsbD N-terminal domain-containing protein [Pyrinomonadaceae bacterium]|jgi:DsbC/DsbD-like thiol-disulfide interchange protein